MSVELIELINRTAKTYEIKVLAGEKRISNRVQWVHIIEDEEMTGFLHGYELVFTTGFGRKDTKWIVKFAKSLYSIGASGLILSVGKHIKTVPQDVIDYCNEVGLPLIYVPWKVKLVDLTRIYCASIISSEENENKVINAFKGLIFSENEKDYYKSKLESCGFDGYGNYIVAVINVNVNSGEVVNRFYEKIKFHTEKIVKHRCEKHSIYCFSNKIVIIFSEISYAEIKTIINEIFYVNKCDAKYKINIGVGYNGDGIDCVSDNYFTTLRVLNLAINRNKSTLFYDEIGIYKLLISNDKQQSMEDFYDSYIGKVERYDESNNTNYVDFLKKYIKSGYCIQDMADSEFVHRNTIHYQLNKLKRILDCDINDWEIRLELFMGLCIQDILHNENKY